MVVFAGIRCAEVGAPYGIALENDLTQWQIFYLDVHSPFSILNSVQANPPAKTTRKERQNFVYCYKIAQNRSVLLEMTGAKC